MSEINANTIKAAGYDFEQVEENIFIVKNFMSQEESMFYYNLAENKTEEEWVGEYLKGIENRSEERYGTRDLNESKLEVTVGWNDKVISITSEAPLHNLDKRLESLFDKDAKFSFRTFGIIQRQYTGAELGGHYDQYVDNRMKWAAVAYINDNYVDGELYFSEKGIQLRPPIGSVVIFPATKEYWHGVNKVGDGPTRYAMPSFVWSEENVF